MPDTNILLIGNYPRDGQVSMESFARLILETDMPGIRKTIVRPAVVLARWGHPHRGAGKWLGYVDKMVLFPVWLLIRRLGRAVAGRRFAAVHILDHSNAYYSFCFPQRRVVATCHDLLAVRAGIGEAGTGCRTSFIGRWLQRSILAGLSRAERVVCDSTATYADYARLVPESENKQRGRIVLVSLNADFNPTESSHAVAVLRSLLPFTPATNFLFYVGSALPRKNRKTLVKVFDELCAGGWDGWLVMAGEGLADDIAGLVAASPQRERICFVGKVSHEQLCALYSTALTLVFPSYAEGFGWPPVEANACGCPVVASNTTSLPEVCGEGALLCDPDDLQGFTQAVRQLTDPTERAKWVERGFKNAARFSRAAMAAGYREVYDELRAMS